MFILSLMVSFLFFLETFLFIHCINTYFMFFCLWPWFATVHYLLALLLFRYFRFYMFLDALIPLLIYSLGTLCNCSHIFVVFYLFYCFSFQFYVTYLFWFFCFYVSLIVFYLRVCAFPIISICILFLLDRTPFLVL